MGWSVGWFWHHGVYLGRNQVIHFHGKVHKLDASFPKTSIEKTSIDKFLDGDAREYCELIKYKNCLAKEDIVRRAKSLLYVAKGGCDEKEVEPLTIRELQKLIEYSLPTNNCEHVATWCVVGEKQSAQVRFYVGPVGEMLAHYVFG